MSAVNGTPGTRRPGGIIEQPKIPSGPDFSMLAGAFGGCGVSLWGLPSPVLPVDSNKAKE